MIVQLQTQEETLAFGQKLGQLLVNTRPWPTILLFGDLGAGKTTMVRGLVGGLPGCDMAEVTSPSFNLVNHYPTTPPVAHVDLYRLDNLGPAGLDDELYEVLEDELALIVVEWAERIPEGDQPSPSLELHWSVQGTLRTVEIRAKEKALLEQIGLMI
ncbi:MAG: tRNA (adenosine(37)-N6)-threonylcarbamoyltransferase complex ATPase subunit type 1 TsaE, partial [Proteobacteria bacterium]|nr:tRNA (adenosine(37)-N6)-threonylcarbamoyltransferase complex ATPase subunit type 1 TsaE [Pseudomonadota bacterium]